MEAKYYSVSAKKTLKILNSDSKKGLSGEEVRKRRKEHGFNEFSQAKELSRFGIFLEQLRSPFVYILIIAAVVTLFLKEYTDFIVIAGSVFVNTFVGFLQENKASNALKLLKKAIKHEAKVIREGSIRIVESLDLVPGDVFILSPGDKVPADGRIIKSYNLKTNEMALTGEWLSAEKKDIILSEGTALAERDNMVYMGTVAEDGKAKVVVTETGIRTEVGKITMMIKEAKEQKTPYQKRLAHFSTIVGAAIAFACLFIFIMGTASGKDFTEMFMTSIAVAVSAIPEGLPVAMTVILALGMQKILKKKGLVRKLASAETLGSTSIICSDKTGTLTEGKMEVAEIVSANDIIEEKSNLRIRSLILRISTLANDAFIEKTEKGKVKLGGRPTDKALLAAGLKSGIDKEKLEKEMKLVKEFPFDTNRKYIAKIFKNKKGRHVLYLCGAPEKIIENSTYFESEVKPKELSLKKSKVLNENLDHLTEKGMRIIAAAYKVLPLREEVEEIKDIEPFITKLVFAGFLGIKDPVRKEAKEAIKRCREAGIRTVIVTGDHKLTAKAVAEELGFEVKENNILTGIEMDKLSEREFADRVASIQVYARVEPRHKIRIIKAWREKGQVVAMTGDGINDAPALKEADVGIALGSGTEVAKEASDLILLSNSFSIIASAVEEGRAILDNVRKVITYLLSDSFTEVILIGAAVVAGFPLPLTAVQILWVNLIEDGLPGISLSFEPKERDLMKRKPQKRNVPLLNKEMKTIIFIIGISTDILLLGLFFWLWNQNHNITYVRTMIFACLTVDSLFYVFCCKSLRRNIWHINPFSNKFLLFSAVIGVLMLLAAVYLPWGQIMLKTTSLGFGDWLIVFGLGLIELLLIEIAKYHFISKKDYA